MAVFLQSVLIVFSFLLVYVWQQAGMSVYTVPLLGFLVFVYLIGTRNKLLHRSTRKPAAFWRSESLILFIITTTVLLLIGSTGGMTSALFFLLYFILFTAAFLLEPLTVFTFAICCFFFFLPDILKLQTLENWLKLGSLVLISPLAYFFGWEFREREKQEAYIEDLRKDTEQAADKIEEDVVKLLQNGTNSPSELEKLKDIVEQTEQLKEEIK